MITAVIGSGGKTSLIHKLADEYRLEGKKVFITTTTHMYPEDGTVTVPDPDMIISEMNENGLVMAGIPSGEKITSLPEEVFKTVSEFADETLVEADGSRHLPVKVPNETEPVIPEGTDRIILVTGLHALGRSIKEAAFRPDDVLSCLGSEAGQDTIITPGHVQKLIRKGYIEKLKDRYPEKELLIHASNDGSLYQRAVAALIENDMDVDMIKEEWFSPKPDLFICGGGHVSRQLADFAARLDFRVTVMDQRPEFTEKQQFPLAEKIICDSFENLEKYLISGAFYAVVTPGHVSDFDCVSTILKSEYRYLGMIGSRNKAARTFSMLRESGVPEEKISTVHSPIGLSIGAVTPGEIAISILSEIIQIKNAGSSASVSRELLESKEKGILCIVTEKSGSVPRGAGSMMLVTEDGQIDTIGGGIIESEALAHAMKLNGPDIREFRLTNTDAQSLGMVCGGTCRVLFLPV